MIKNILWVVVAIALIAVTVFREYKQAKKKKRILVCREKTERGKAIENEIAIERERSRRTPEGPGGGPWSGGV